MSVREIPLCFDCEGSTLVGIVHVPDTVRARGVLALVAGGPQYRGGVGRLQVQLARELAAGGVPVMRFDYRGLGDSEGTFKGFEDIEADLASAIRAFREQVPGLQEVVLWGGCDAASAIMINAWKYPEVTGIMVGNPWAHTAETGDAVTVKHHYRARMRDKSFWLKVLKLQYNPLPAAATLARAALARLRHRGAGRQAAADSVPKDTPGQPFVLRMRRGMSRFKGDMLVLMSGRSLVSKEFDELVAADTQWQQAMRSPRHVARHDMPNADQTYSAMASRDEVIAVARCWMLDTRADLSAAAAALSASSTGSSQTRPPSSPPTAPPSAPPSVPPSSPPIAAAP
jgi:uncharacterized protein